MTGTHAADGASDVAASRGRRWQAYWWLAPAVAGAVLVVLRMLVLSPQRTLEHWWDVPIQVLPLVLAVLAVAGFPQRPRLGAFAVLATVLAFMSLVDTGYIIAIFDFADAADQQAAFPELYRVQLFVAAFVVVAVLFAFRLGGAGTERVLRVGAASILVVISGLNDLTAWALTDWSDGRPETLYWASHIEVFVGGPPSPAVAVLFCLVHLALAGAVLVVPGRAGRSRARHADA